MAGLSICGKDAPANQGMIVNFQKWADINPSVEDPYFIQFAWNQLETDFN